MMSFIIIYLTMSLVMYMMIFLIMYMLRLPPFPPFVTITLSSTPNAIEPHSKRLQLHFIHFLPMEGMPGIR